MYAKVKDHNHLIRDIQSKAVLNTDKAGLNDYMMKREIAKKQLSEPPPEPGVSVIVGDVV